MKTEFTATDLLVGWTITLDIYDVQEFYGDGYVENNDGLLFRFAPDKYNELKKLCNA